MRFLLPFLLLLPIAQGPPQTFDPCNPGDATPPTLLPCPEGQSRDLEAVIACLNAYWETIADARASACSQGREALIARAARYSNAYTVYQLELALNDANLADCLRDCQGNTECEITCNLIHDDADAAALGVYQQSLADTNEWYETRLTAIELEWVQARLAAMLAYLACIEATAPCEEDE